MKHRRARVYDALAFLTAILVLILDQWTKAWVVINLSPTFFGPRISLIGNYLTLYYIRNNGAAFSLFANSTVLVLLIAVAIGVIAYLYLRNINTGSVWYKLIFGLIIGGALSNLIDNALRFISDGGNIHVSIGGRDGHTEVFVRDTGSGIAPEHLPRVFDRFYRGDASRSSAGTGLGLALVKSIADLHGGSARIESELGSGTTVTLVFPNKDEKSR